MVPVRRFCSRQDAFEIEYGGSGTFLKPYSILWN
jgi:hypothetical protein